jgi:quinol monooxygenase YgiN
MDSNQLSLAFVARIQSAEGSESDLAALLTGAVELANAEAGTPVWFAVRTALGTFWIFDAFANEADRQAHAGGEIVAALGANAHLLGAEPEIMPADILAFKLP